MRVRTIIVSVVFLLLCVSVWAEWYPGIIHAHSTFSDGDRIPEMVIEEAAKSSALFLIVTDHYEQINSSKSVRPDVPDKDFGFENYKKRFAGVPTIGNVAVPLVVIPGAEIAAYHNGISSHTLALGDLAFKDEKLFLYQMNKNTQQAIINRINELGFLSVAAHPHFQCWSPLRPWEITRYLYDKENVKGLCGVEIFNDYDFKQYERTRGWYLTLLRQGNDVFVTSGCDSHSALERKDTERWQRKTWVWSEDWDWTSEKLLESIRRGQTYASNYGASFENLNYIPGFKVQKVNRPEFKFTITFEKKTSSGKTIKIYRDGELISDSVREYTKGLEKIEYSWEDNKVQVGEHRYAIEMEGVLITSPIILNIQESPPLFIVDPGVSYTDYAWRDFSRQHFRKNPTFLVDRYHIDGGEESPCQTYFAFSSLGLKSEKSCLLSQIYIADLKTHQVKRMTNPPYNYSSPKWSPDEKKLAYRVERPGKEKDIFEIETLDIETGQKRIIVPQGTNGLGLFEPEIDWRNDAIVFIGMTSRGDNQFCTVSSTGENFRKILEMRWEDGEPCHPSLSLDAQKIAFHVDKFKDGKSFRDIWVVNLDGTGLRRITEDSRSQDPFFVKGNQIVYVFYTLDINEGNAETWLMDENGSNRRKISQEIQEVFEEEKPLPPEVIESLKGLTETAEIMKQLSEEEEILKSGKFVLKAFTCQRVSKELVPLERTTFFSPNEKGYVWIGIYNYLGSPTLRVDILKGSSLVQRSEEKLRFRDKAGWVEKRALPLKLGTMTPGEYKVQIFLDNKLKSEFMFKVTD